MANITEYLETVREQIRWKRAREPLTQELETHLLEQKSDYLAAGMDEAAAETEAIRQMGDPVQIGQELDAIHRPQPQWKLLLLVGLLAGFGAWLRLYIGFGTTRVLFYLAVGFAALFGTYLLDFTFFVRHARLVYIGTVLLSILSAYHSPMLNGASHYTRYLVLLYPLLYALFLTTLRGRGWDGLLFAALGAIPLMAIAAVVPSLSGLLMFLISGFVTLLLAICSGWFRVSKRSAISVLCITAAICCVMLFLLYGNAMSHRLSVALHPEQDPTGYGYVAMTLRSLLEDAVWLKQPANTISELIWLSDYLLALLISEVGWMPFLLLCAALLGLLFAAVPGCLRQKNRLGRLISLSIILTFGMQMLLSIPGNLGYPFLYTACPFIDGNFHTVLDMALVGVLLSIFRQEALPLSRVCTPAPSGSPKRIRLENGNLIIPIFPK